VSAKSERKAFLAALEKNEDDTTTRLVFADWLDENGEHEEADRMRKWPAAKEWLVRLCEHNNTADLEEEWIITYEKLVELGRQAMKEAGESGGFGFWATHNDAMCHALATNTREYWTNWSIVTGVPVPPDADQKSYFCAC
jgi:uncharacterized protein (TIGR02996 family)